MTRKLPALPAREIIRALERTGFRLVRSKGSHRIYQHMHDATRRTVIPDHGPRDLPRGTLRAIIDQCGLSVDEFLDLL
jgi:predicted RNA binding protein YcfA (HicA-like mRNA interferase family)